jgi:Mg2+ and Co2+ transporter CorA
MRNFLDTFIDMKLDECEEALVTISGRVDDIERRLFANLNDPQYLENLAEEYSKVIIEKHRLANSHSRLLAALHKRNMEAFVNDPDNQPQE